MYHLIGLLKRIRRDYGLLYERCAKLQLMQSKIKEYFIFCLQYLIMYIKTLLGMENKAGKHLYEEIYQRIQEQFFGPFQS